MSDKNLLDPKDNDLIPDDDPDDPVDDELKELMKSDLFPDDGLITGPPNDLCPDYVEPKKRVMARMGKGLMSLLTDAAEGRCNRVQVDIGGGITASSCPGGGLSIFKDGVQVHSVDGLSAKDQKIINDYRERNKPIPPD
jgi:hypothetical protein